MGVVREFQFQGILILFNSLLYCLKCPSLMYRYVTDWTHICIVVFVWQSRPRSDGYMPASPFPLLGTAHLSWPAQVTSVTLIVTGKEEE